MQDRQSGAAATAGRCGPVAVPLPAAADPQAALGAILRAVSGEGAWTTCRWENLTLSSRFQPIIGTAERRVVGYEGLLRAHDAAGRAVSPAALFESSAARGDPLCLDWLARALHLRNIRNLGSDAGLLFVNAAPEAAIRDPHCAGVFATLIDRCGGVPGGLVIEITESAATDEALLVDAVNLYKSLGCAVAIDDFGAGSSDVRRIWRLQPDIVKLDRAVLAAAAVDGHARKVMRNLVNMMHDCGARVVLEGIGNRAEAEAALDTSADYLQGFFFGRPEACRLPEASLQRVFAALWPEARIISVDDRASAGDDGPAWRGHAEAMLASTMAMDAGASFSTAAQLLHSLPGTLRCYLLAADGGLLASSIDRQAGPGEWPAPDAAVHRTGWQVKRLTAAAAAEPGAVKLTMDHCSNDADIDADGARPGMTLCCGFGHPARIVVLGVDIVPR